MLYARFITLVLLFRGQAAYIHDFMAFEQFWEQDGSGMDGSGMDGSGMDRSGFSIKEWPPFDDPSQTCDGTRDQVINITFTDITGCYQFQTPFFNDGGYLNSTAFVETNKFYICQFDNLFGDNDVMGTVTIFKEGFEFPKNGDCVDYFGIGVVDEIRDPDDFSNVVGFDMFCGTLSSDKERTFNSNFISFELFADRTISGNGAEVLLCFD
ncbi:uncharacterized protein LOC131891918 [Tigriopus californicus]|uniref:uncharacterized protein LOC131891918 n=1 Tax=Tigriopus californicus TaxID=6832 RepID=UPI0027DA486D|nr:uncharacterized protein LOC131891918 [Tigriopus californicus]